jgi:anti-anti-sigma regulatory factor
MAYTSTEVLSPTLYFAINQEPLLDASSRLRLKLEFEEYSNQAASTICLDMQGIITINSSGIALLLELKKISIRKRLKLKFINIHPPLLDKIVAVGLGKILFCD